MSCHTRHGYFLSSQCLVHSSTLLARLLTCSLVLTTGGMHRRRDKTALKRDLSLGIIVAMMLEMQCFILLFSKACEKSKAS
mmetsp:Transcript_61906/g.102723  ORF Transcript_61906/g.102723 Transcript_61906/m.102723 type:complete len:81 (-) Transcript_61906:230-472(-)